jgi:hypothetical protein
MQRQCVCQLCGCSACSARNTCGTVCVQVQRGRNAAAAGYWLVGTNMEHSSVCGAVHERCPWCLGNDAGFTRTCSARLHNQKAAVRTCCAVVTSVYSLGWH